MDYNLLQLKSTLYLIIGHFLVFPAIVAVHRAHFKRKKTLSNSSCTAALTPRHRHATHYGRNCQICQKMILSLVDDKYSFTVVSQIVSTKTVLIVVTIFFPLSNENLNTIFPLKKSKSCGPFWSYHTLGF